MDEDALPAGQPAVQVAVEVAEHAAGVARRREREVHTGHGLLLVGLQVVRGRQERHHPGEALHLQPDDLLLPTNLAVVGSEPPGPLAHGQPVPDDPGEVARWDPRGPLALHHPDPDRSGPTSCAAWTVAATSCTRTI